MAKRKSNTPVVINKSKFLLPKMEWHTVDETTGEGFFVRDIGGHSLFEFKELADQYKGKTMAESLEMLAWLTARGACDKAGHLIFADEDIPMLVDKPAVILEVSEKVMRLSGISVEAKDNLKNDQPASSTTESPTS